MLPINFEEYNLSNGLHVILHQDDSAPTVMISVMYKVGAKNDPSDRKGLAHFFEHLLFEGTKNIKRGEWFKIVQENGGQNNASTDSDCTYYYEIFPSNQLALGLWMESERMRHAVIEQIGIDTQREVIVQENNQNYNNKPYGQLWSQIRCNIFENHPYRNTIIGSMDELKNATLDDFLQFYQKYYTPNNAVLTISGDFNREETKKLVKDYFESIPKGEIIQDTFPQENPIKENIKATFHDALISVPAFVWTYRTPATTHQDADVLDVIADILGEGKGSPFYQSLIESKLAIDYFVHQQRYADYSLFIIHVRPMSGINRETINAIIDKHLDNLQTNRVSDREIQKRINNIEINQINFIETLSDVNYGLCRYYLLYNDTHRINDVFQFCQKLNPDLVQRVAQKYFLSDKRLELDYFPLQ